MSARSRVVRPVEEEDKKGSSLWLPAFCGVMEKTEPNISAQ